MECRTLGEDKRCTTAGNGPDGRHDSYAVIDRRSGEVQVVCGVCELWNVVMVDELDSSAQHLDAAFQLINSNSRVV